MNVTYACPKCQVAVRAELESGVSELRCPHCEAMLSIPGDAIEADEVRRCVACGSNDLFARKDFPQRLGVTLVTLGLLASCVAWGYGRLYWTFGILFATALIDVVLYVVVPNALMCYRCAAMYRGASEERHGAFNLETHERYRQQRIRLEQVKGSGGGVQGSGVQRAGALPADSAAAGQESMVSKQQSGV